MNQNPDYTFYPNQSPTPPMSPLLQADLPRARKAVGICAAAVAMVFLLATVAQFLMHGIVSIVYPALIENDWYIWLLSSVPMYLVAMPVAYLFMRLVPAQKPQKRKLHPLMWVGFLCLCFAVTYGANILGQYFSYWFSNLTGIQIENELEEMTINTPFALNLLFVGILAPVFEELFFRKAVIDRLRRYGDLPAVLISGLAFGLVHGNFNQVFYTVAVGVLLSFIYVRTGSVLYTISIHAAFNFVGGVYSTELLRRVGETLTPAEGDVVGMIMVAAYALFMIASLIVGTVFFIVNVKKFYQSLQKGEENLSFGEWMRVIFRNPGVWMFLAMVALLFVSSLLG